MANIFEQIGGGLLGGVAGAFEKVVNVIKGKLPPEQQLEFEKLEANFQSELIKAKSNVLIAEIQGKSWLQRNWRPILMLVIIFIIFNNYVLFPYLNIFTDKIVILELPKGLWALMTLGVGGYVGGRSAEKIFGAKQ